MKRKAPKEKDEEAEGHHDISCSLRRSPGNVFKSWILRKLEGNVFLNVVVVVFMQRLDPVG